MLEHGGRLRQAALTYGIPLADWLDLSTGINPEGWPVPPLPPEVWQRLPEDDDGLEAAAADYYGNPRLLPLAGSQAAIQYLPRLMPLAALVCVSPLYEEHPAAWQRAGHRVRRLNGGLERALTAATPGVLLCNPNNPTARAYDRGTVLEAAQRLGSRGGWLLVDEAFVDPEPARSVTDLAGSREAPNLLVLRSLGKFFGLAGARVGFLFGDEARLAPLKELLGPWALSHPARAVARLALADRDWQAAARQRLAQDSLRLAELLAPLGDTAVTPLFATLSGDFVPALHAHLARHGILTRLFPDAGLLRFGLPGQAADWARLSAALSDTSWRTCP